MDNSLFRIEALKERKEKLYGSVLLMQPTAFHFITPVLVLIILCTLILLFQSTYSRRETVNGYLVPSKGLFKIYVPTSGILSRTHITEGSKVKKGQILFTISTSKINKDGVDRESLLLVELSQQEKEIRRKMEQEMELFLSQKTFYKKQSLALHNQLTQLDSSIQLLDEQLNIKSSKLKKHQSLFQSGYVSKSQLTDVENAYIESQLALQSSQQRKIELESLRTEMEEKERQLPLEWESYQSDLNRQLSDISQKIVEISGRRTFSIKAPVSGTLTALQASEGQALTPNALVVAILPEGSELHAELFLPTRAVGFAQEGQQVLLRYEAFPYQQYGLYNGSLSNIAKVILTPNELPIPVSLQEPVYRVKVKLDKQTVSAYGKELSLQAGMLLEADIILDERSLIEWLLEPIYGLRGRL